MKNGLYKKDQLGLSNYKYFQNMSKNRHFLQAQIQSFRRRIALHILNQKTSPPLFFFLFYLIEQLQIFQNNVQSIVFLLLPALIIFVLMDYNLLFVVAPLIQSDSAGIAVIAQMVGLLGCNEEWKLLLYVFGIGYRLMKSIGFGSEFVILGSALIMLQIYTKLIFKSKTENIQYFTGFFVFAVYQLLQLAAISFDTQISTTVQFTITAILMLVGYQIIIMRIDVIRNIDMNFIRHGRLLAFHLRLIQEKYNNQIPLLLKINSHIAKCSVIDCFCHTRSQNINFTSFYLRHLYERFINNSDISEDSLFFEDYFNLLLKDHQLIDSVFYFNKIKNKSFLNQVAYIRIDEIINKFLHAKGFDNPYQKEYNYALMYDQHYLHFIKQIHSILSQKIFFWRQIEQITPSAKKIQDHGMLTNSKINQLNQFYHNIVKEEQSSLKVFQITSLYSLFLYSTTNYKDLAESIVKNAYKELDQRRDFLKNTTQTYSIRAYVHSAQNYFIKDTKKLSLDFDSQNDSYQDALIATLTQISFQQIKTLSFKLIIDSVSNGLLKLLKMDRSDLIGEELNKIIPDGYKQVHNVRLNSLLDFQRIEVKEIAASKVLHTELTLPMKGSNDQLFYAMIYIKIHNDTQKGLTFFSILKKSLGQDQKALLDYNGCLTEKQQKFNQAILFHSQFQKYLVQMRQLWEIKKQIHQQKFNITINSVNYTVSISSPLIVLFLDKFQSLKIKNPPFHVSVKRQGIQIIRQMKSQTKIRAIKQINDNKHISESSISSTKGQSSSINILLSFQQQNSIPIYRSIYLIFVCLIFICLATTSIAHFNIHLEWDNTQLTNNPISDIVSLQKIQFLTIKALLYIGDFNEIKTRGQSLNNTEISSYFFANDYEHSLQSILQTLKQNIQNELNWCFYSSSQILSQQLQNYFSLTINTSNPNSPIYNQLINYQQLLMNYLIDLQLIIDTHNSDNIIIKNTYNQQIVNNQQSSQYVAVIQDSIRYSKMVVYVVYGCLTFVLLVAMGYFANVLRARLDVHERIYDMLISIDHETIKKEVKEMKELVNVLKNWKQHNFSKNMMIMSKDHIGSQPLLLNDKQSKSNSQNRHVAQMPNKNKSGADRQKKRKLSTIKGKRLSKADTSTIFTSLAHKLKQDINQSWNFGQKRGKQLNWMGYQCDKSKLVYEKHLYFYFIFFFFVLFYAMFTINQQLYYQQIDKAKQNIISTLTFHNKQGIAFLLTQGLLRGNFSDLYEIQPPWDIKVIPTNEFTNTTTPEFYSITSQIISKVTQYSQYYSQGYSAVQPNCSDNNSSYIQKYCKLQYSYLILLGEYGSFFKSLLEIRLNADSMLISTSSQKYNQLILQISQRLFYLQSLYTKLQTITQSYVEESLRLMINFSQQFERNRLLIYLGVMGWGLLGVVIGFVIIQRSKQQYIRQTCFLSLLNNDMLTKNKRIETFILSLQKLNR